MELYLMEKQTPIDIAVSAVGGKQKDLAKKVGLTPQRISAIKKNGGSLPRTKMREFMMATGLSKEVLYPDIFH